MKKHGGLYNARGNEVGNPYFVQQLKKRRAKNKVAKASRKRNRA